MRPLERIFMTTPNPTDPEISLDETIEQLLREMSYVPCDSDEYARMADQLQKIYVLKETDSKKRVSPDTLAIVLGNLAGVLLIVGHERVHIITSKALNFILRPR
jgi:hypothetical protein